MVAGWLFERAAFARHGHGHAHGGRGFGRRWREFGPRGFMGEWPGGPRARRGDVKFLILEVLAERPMHGYDVMRALEERRGEGYRASAGSIYPTLQMLEDGGFVTSEPVDGKRVYTITDAGRQLLAERAQPADAEGESAFEAHVDLRGAAVKLAAAVVQTARTHDPALEQRAKDILDRARREIYALLAEEHEA